MRKLLGFAIVALLVLLAPAAWAVDDTVYPTVVLDPSCTDSNDTPARPADTGPISFVGTVAVVAQDSGSADGYCDHNYFIRTGAQTSDVTFGPFNREEIDGIVVYLDGDTVGGGDTKYHVGIGALKPHDAAVVETDVSTDLTGNGDVVISFGTDVGTPNGISQNMEAPLPGVFYLLLDLNTATSWAGDISMLPWWNN